MNLSVLNPRRDPMGHAILDYQQKGSAQPIRVLSTMFDDDEIEVPYLFRTLDAMPRLERLALSMAKGRVLDVGAGSGCHTLALQQRGVEVSAIDISPLSVQAMHLRGIHDVRCINFFDPRVDGPFDTILLLMNGSGIVGSLRYMPQFFSALNNLLADDGQVLIDSSDLKYLYENEDGSYDIDPAGPYYGEVDYQMVYGDVKGEKFNWLYVDFQTLQLLAGANGFDCELIAEGDHYDYLASIKRKS